ncbi:Chromo-like domain superfamily [Sesbania bispinosa]|nr:Chromo-like domain superfamily [Sesbania bispinosa]
MGSTDSPLALPPQIVANKPLITPLVVLAKRWDSSVTPPKLQVLIQWQGLSSDETSWEDWDTLKVDYHLEDKMFLEALGNDRGMDADAEISQDNADLDQANCRPKRKVTRPKALEDYELRTPDLTIQELS